MDYLILSQRSTFDLEKDRRSNWIRVLRKNLVNYVYLKDINKNLKEIGIIHFVSKLTIFLNLSFALVCTNKKFGIMQAWVQLLCEKLNLSVKHSTHIIIHSSSRPRTLLKLWVLYITGYNCMLKNSTMGYNWIL